MKQWAQKQTGFTIVELLIVVVVIAILAAITIVAYNGINQRAKESALKNSATQTYKKIESYKVANGEYPASLSVAGIVEQSGIEYDFRTFPYGSCVSLKQGSSQIHVGSDSGNTGTGTCGQVKAEYFNNTSFSGAPVLTRYEEQINNIWGTGSPEPGVVNSDQFTARYTSYIVPPVSGSYTFSVYMDDLERVVINDVLLSDGITANSGCCVTRVLPAISLTAGQAVPVVVSMREGGGSAYIRLSWSHPNQASAVPVPPSAFVRVP